MCAGVRGSCVCGYRRHLCVCEGVGISCVCVCRGQLCVWM